MGWCDEVLGFCDASGGEVDPPHSAEEVEARLAALPIEDLVKAWREVSTITLAAAWVEITSRSDLARERDDDWGEMFDFQSDLVGNDPLGVLELVKTVLEIEDKPQCARAARCRHAEGPDPRGGWTVVDAVVAEAEHNPKFRQLLDGVWFYGMSPEVTERIMKARGEVSW